MKRGLLLAAVEKISGFKADLGGVFSYADLSNILATGSTVANSRALNRLVMAKILLRVQRGFYVTPSFDLFRLACRLAPNSYISMDSALARAGCIGTIPTKRVSVVRPAMRNKKVKTPAGEIIYCSLLPELFFGFKREKNGVAMASPEKAFLDLLYFHTKGQRFVIDPTVEVDISKLNKRVLVGYLKKYKNPKFIAFARRMLHA